MKTQCQRGQTFAYNVWSNITCSPTDRQAPLAPLFVDGDPADGTMNLRLIRGAAAVGRGDPTNHPVDDHDGRMRPVHLAPDAGAAQRETAALVLGQSIGEVSFRESREAVIGFYGNPRRSINRKVGTQKQPVRVDIYRIHGGSLRITYKDDVVVGLATDSAFYTTPKGLGRGTAIDAWSAAKGGHWNICRKAFGRRVGPRVVYFVTGGLKRLTIRDITMIGVAYDEPCDRKH